MPSSLFPGSSPIRPQAAANNPMAMIGQIQKFAGQLKGKDPQQLVMNYCKQNGIGDGQFRQTMAQAKQLCQMMGLK